MFQILFSIAFWLIQLLQPILVPLCFVIAWSFVLLTAWSLWSAMRDGMSNAKRMHQIPCANCQFFTGDYHLKCTVRPTTALSESAIDCIDYEPIESSVPAAKA
jgi:hypothetical protein